MSEVMQQVASPVAVDFASFEDDVAMLFPDPAMPIKAVATTVSMATDEDAWLFGSDKLGVAVRDIHVTSAEPLTIDLPHHNDDDLTSILMSPILGSPVDELDAMTSFLDEHVDPFQQVPVSSDDEPMSPASSPINTRRSSAASAAPFDAKKLDKLKATVANLEKIYYARSHGSKQLDLVRALERAQRITCNVARENFAFRASAMPRKAREELLLQEMSTVLKGAMMNTQIEQSVTDTVCSTLIENTASRAADAAKGLVTGTGESFMGWHSVKYVDATTGLMMFNAMKDFSIDNTSKFDAINSQSWDLMVSSDNFVSFMNSASSGKTVRSHLIKKLSDDAMLIAFDYVVSDNLSARVEREVCVAFRACTSTGTLIGVSSLSPTLFESTLHSVDGVKFIEAGMRWVQFSASKAKADGTNDATVDRFRVVGGGRAHCQSKEAADTAHMESLALLLQWERHMIAPLFSL